MIKQILHSNKKIICRYINMDNKCISLNDISYNKKKYRNKNLRPKISTIYSGKKMFYRFLKENDFFYKFLSYSSMFNRHSTEINYIIKYSFINPFDTHMSLIYNMVKDNFYSSVDNLREDLIKMNNLKTKWTKILKSIKYI